MVRNEKGFSLIEVIIALALLSIIAAAFLSGMATASRGMFTTDERATAESLAKSQMEYAKNQPYAPSYTPTTIPYDGYAATITVGNVPGALGGIQKITVSVSHHGRLVITLEDYKVN